MFSPFSQRGKSMTGTTRSDQRRAFAMWLRTGRIPVEDGIEHKFNPWHDPENGRFTFAGSGQSSGNSSRSAIGIGGGLALPRSKETPRPRAQTTPQPLPAKPGIRAAIRPLGQKPAPKLATAPAKRASATTEFVSGVGQSVYETAAGTVSGAYSALTTNPLTTIRNTEMGIAQAIDTTIAAEDVSARIQVSRAASAIAHASPRDIGRAVGSVAGNTVLMVAPGATLGKIAALRRLRNAPPARPPYVPPDIRWVKETLNTKNAAAKHYNDAAFGARPGQAPAIMRTVPNGSRRPVKFDGLRANTLIDRKMGVSGKPHAVDQILRQSQALSENNLTGMWEVPTAAVKRKSLKLFKKHGVTNISVRIVKP